MKPNGLFMNQPELGKKISELRLAKGLTQRELAEICNLSLRTIQRIETAKVTPRSYTVKLIFSSLEYEIYDSFGKLSYKLDRSAYIIKMWLGQFYRYVLDLFNLKTKTMKKIAILSIPFFIISAIFLFADTDSLAQNRKKIEKQLAEQNSKFISWFNNGQIDSLGSLYLNEASMVPDSYKEINGKENIKGYYEFLYQSGFRFNQIKTKTLVISKSIVVEKGIWNTSSDINITGTYMTQWRKVNGKWYIENEMTNTDFIGASGLR